MPGIAGIYIYNEKGEVIGATGGKLAALKNLKKDPDFYSKLGKKGAEAYNAKPKEDRKPRGFAYNPELASRVGAIGGSISRRRKQNESK